MQRTRGSLTVLALGLVAVPTALVAQTSSTAALAGTIRDSAGHPVAGAVVRISSAAMIGGEKTATTSANGAYRFAALPPGIYKIAVSAKGHPALNGTEVLELGLTSTVNWKFPASASATVEVVGAMTTVEDTAVSITQNFDTQALSTLPVERSVVGIMNLTPGVNDSRAWGGYRGENAYMMDGINIGDPSGGTQWIFPNVDWFSEVQVAGLGANAEFGGFMGGFVNGLVKRGGNTFEGSFNAYYADSKWQAKGKQDHPMVSAADKIIPPSKNWDVAFNVGGPIVKDKLWFFASAERTEEDNTPTGAPTAQRNQKVMALAKVTWAASQNATLEFLAEYDYVGRDRRYVDYTTMPEATQKEVAPNHSYSLTWTQTFGQDKVLTLKAFSYGGRYDQPGMGGNAYSVDLQDLYEYDATKAPREFFFNSTYEDYNFRGRTTLSATFDWFKTGLFSAGDSHAFRFGIEREQVSDEELERFPGNINLNAEFDDVGVYTSYMIVGGGWNVRQRADRLAAFVQDTWKINDRITLNPGVRFEQFKGRFYGASNLWNQNTVAPRFGFAIGLTEDLKTMLKGHWGRYYAGYSTYFIDRAIQDAIPIKQYYDWADPGYPYINLFDRSTWPSTVPGYVDPVTGNQNDLYRTINDLTLVDPGAKQPYTDELTFALDHKFGATWSAGLSWVSRDFKDSLVRVDRAPDPSGYWSTYVNPITGGNIDYYRTRLYGDEHQYWVTNAGNEGKRKYTATTLKVDRRLENNWSLGFSYTHSKLEGNIQRADSYDKVFYNKNTMINAYGNLPGNNDDEFKAHALYQFPTGTRISAVYTYLSGTHWNQTYRTAAFDGTRYVINVEPLGSRTYPSRSLLDLRLTQTFRFGAKVATDIFVECLNVLNRQAATAYTTRINTNNNATSSVYSYYMYPESVDPGRRLQLGLRVNF